MPGTLHRPGPTASLAVLRATSPAIISCPAGPTIRRALNPAAIPGGVGVHRYAPEVEGNAPRGVANAPQAPAGDYQFLGGNVFRRVALVGADWQPVPDPLFYFHHASSGTMRVHTSASPRRGDPQIWNPPKTTKSNAGSAIGRADDDIYPLGWLPIPGANPEQEAQATELAGRLGLQKVLDLTGWQVVPTVEGSPLVLVMGVGSDTTAGEDWAGRDQKVDATTDDMNAIWNELAQRDSGRIKDSGDWTPAPHATPRTMRPTSKYFGNRSATEAFTAEQNADRSAEKTPYEWFHLIGDADGGGNRPDNLVSATTAANTEQLVLETVQRQYRELLTTNGLNIQIAGSATLIPTDPSLPANYAHVANWLRYVVTISSKDKRIRVLDHIFDAHRQKISKATTIVMLAQAELAIDTALAKEFGVTRTRTRQAEKTVPNIAARPEKGPPIGRSADDLADYLLPVCDCEPTDGPLIDRLRAALGLGFTIGQVKKVLGDYGIPYDELTPGWNV